MDHETVDEIVTLVAEHRKKVEENKVLLNAAKIVVNRAGDNPGSITVTYKNFTVEFTVGFYTKD